MVLAVLLTATLVTTAFATPHFMHLVGFYSHTSYPAGSDEVRFYAVEFRGDWEYEDLALVAEYGKSMTDKGYCSDALRYNSRWIGQERFVVLGWKNMTRNEGGWVALALDDKNGCIYYADTGSTGRASTWTVMDWKTNDHVLKVRFIPHPDGSVEWEFLSPE